jgi:hypothetical protein
LERLLRLGSSKGWLALKELDILGGHCGYDREVTVSGRRFVEAIVSPHDEDVLCGIYKLSSRSIGTIKHSAADVCELDAAETDSSDYSWWPKASIWESSGMNYGYWVPSKRPSLFGVMKGSERASCLL